MSETRHRDDAASLDSTQVRHQKSSQREVAEMIDSEVRFESITGTTSIQSENTRIVHQSVDCLVVTRETLRELSNRTEVCEIDSAHEQLTVRCRGSDAILRTSCSLLVSARQNHPGICAREITSCFEADS